MIFKNAIIPTAAGKSVDVWLKTVFFLIYTFFTIIFAPDEQLHRT